MFKMRLNKNVEEKNNLWGYLSTGKFWESRFRKHILWAMSTSLFIRAAQIILSTITPKPLIFLDAMRVSPERREHGFSLPKWINSCFFLVQQHILF